MTQVQYLKSLLKEAKSVKVVDNKSFNLSESLYSKFLDELENYISLKMTITDEKHKHSVRFNILNEIYN